MRFSYVVLPVLLFGALGSSYFWPEAATLPAPVAPAGTTTPNLAPLLLTGSEGQPVHNGFFDRSRQRLEMVFSSVRRDAKNPNLYHVLGKDRRFRKVESFAGTIVFAPVQLGAALKQPVAQEERQANGLTELVAPGLATGTFELRETPRPNDPDAGTFRGKIVIDFLTRPDKSVVLNYNSTSALTRNAGFLLEGTWTSAKTGGTWPILVLNGTHIINSRLMPNFEIGDRGGEINPRYARVGWDTYWENTEWWAEKKVAQR